MTADLEQRRHGDNDSTATSATAAEDTPLLRSETASSLTARDAPPRSERTPADGSEQPLGRKRATCIVLSMWALIFLQASNMSGITTTQSTIAADLDAYESAMWFTSSYMISMSSVAPLAGRLAMIFSSANMILLSAGCFALGAFITALAPTFAAFILGRVLQGVGSGGIMTLCMILTIQLTSKRRRGLWIGLTNAGFTIGVSAGAVVFAALLPVLGWRLLFGAQAPMAALAGLAVCFSIPNRHEDSKNRTTLQKLAGIDYAGAATLCITIVLFLYGLSGTIQPLPILLSLVTLAIFLIVESYARDPVIPLPVLKSRGVLLSCFAQLGFMASRWTVLFYAPIFVLAVRGLSPAVAGSVLIPTNLGFGLGGLLVGAVHIRHAGSFWLPAWAALALFTVALFALAFVSNAASPAGLYVAVIFLNGLCTGAALNYTLAHLLHLSSPEMHFIVTGLLSTFRGFAGSFGTAIGGGVFTRTLRGALTEGFSRLGGGGGGKGLDKAHEKMIAILIGSPAAVFQEGFLSAAEREVAVHGYERALEVLYKSAAALCVLVVIMQAGTGWTAPESGKAEEEQVDEGLAEADGTMEA
ncbi:hypothetical protein VTK56DRAFT_9253 [Thermocarpiscus australiensis]